MNTVPDTLLNRAEDKTQVAGQEQKAESYAQLVEMGKVSDTHGSWLGVKTDVGMGFTAY